MTIFLTILLNTEWIFMHCLLGKLVTDRFNQLPDYLFNTKWYKLPVKVQKYFILLLANTQQPLLFHGFGIYVLDLEKFASVCRILIFILKRDLNIDHVFLHFQTMNRVYSNYMMFRTIAFK